jgi:dihydrodipicolinate synthase/N-acetylneuraminate lyase
MWWKSGLGALQMVSGMAANQQARETARQNAKLMEMETGEQLRRMDREQVYRMGDAIAQSGASGLMLSGSTGRAVHLLENEYQRQRAWVKSTGAQQARVARGAGQLSGLDQFISGIGTMGAATNFGQGTKTGKV